MADEHKIVLQSWDVYECQLSSRTERTRHVVGKINFAGEVVISAALKSVNFETREAKDETGAIYILGGQIQGSPGVDTKFAWWRDKQGATDVTCMTIEVRDALLSKLERK